MIMRKVRNQPRTTQEDLVNDLKAAGTIVTKKQLILRQEGLKSCSAHKVPLLKKVHVKAHLKFANDSEDNWVKVLLSGETQIHVLASTQLVVFREECCLWTTRSPSPPSNMEVETLCFGGGFLLRGQDNCTASRDDGRGHAHLHHCWPPLCFTFLKQVDFYKAHRSEKQGVFWLASYPVHCDWLNTQAWDGNVTTPYHVVMLCPGAIRQKQ